MKTIAELASDFRQKQISPVEVTRACLERIERMNPLLNAFITVTAESAMAEARRAEEEIAQGKWRGPLHGVPIGLKDLIDTAGVRTTAGSKVFEKRIPEEDAEVVCRLRRAGAVILGKNNLHEFAYGGSSLVSAFGDVRNPNDQEHIAGGSSGGSAAAVGGDLCYAAIGTDTAGSIREPAALCGCVGLKPTHGRVSTRGVIPLSWSLDHVGPLTRSAGDSAIVLQTIGGYDAGDPCSVQVSVSDYSGGSREEVKSLRVGIPREFFYDDLDHEVQVALEEALVLIGKLVKEVREMKLEVPTDRMVQSAESFAYHAEMVRESPELYQPETLRRIRTGENISATEYIQKRRELDRERRRAHKFFSDIDLLITPTTPIPAPAVDGLKKDAAALRPAELKLLRNTRPFNVWGLPAISIPCGENKMGLPIGLQIAGAPWREDLVLTMARAYESA